jgi:hypothetical protein
MVRAGEEVIAAARCDEAQSAFGDQVVDLDAAIVSIAHERVP